MISPMRLEIVGAQEQLLARGEEDVPVLQQATERDVVRVGKRRAVSPGLAHCPRTERPCRRRIQRPCCRAANRCTAPPARGDTRSARSRGSRAPAARSWRRQGSAGRRAVAAAATVPRNGGDRVQDSDCDFIDFTGLMAYGLLVSVCRKASQATRRRPARRGCRRHCRVGDEVAAVLDRGAREPLAALALIGAAARRCRAAAAGRPPGRRVPARRRSRSRFRSRRWFWCRAAAVVAGQSLPVGEEAGRGPAAVVKLQGQQFGQRLRRAALASRSHRP